MFNSLYRLCTRIIPIAFNRFCFESLKCFYLWLNMMPIALEGFSFVFYASRCQWCWLSHSIYICGHPPKIQQLSEFPAAINLLWLFWTEYLICADMFTLHKSLLCINHGFFLIRKCCLVKTRSFIVKKKNRFIHTEANSVKTVGSNFSVL